jgi:hypothetical protein
MTTGLVCGGFLLDYSVNYPFMQRDAMQKGLMRQYWTEACHHMLRLSKH